VKSLGARLAAWYAFAATATLACLFVAGYYLLQQHLLRGLDVLNSAEFEQVKARLGPDYRELDPVAIDERIRETIENTAVLFYVDIHGPASGTIFYSRNLQGQAIPDVKRASNFSAAVTGIGALRVGEFLLDPYEVMIGTPLGQVDQLMHGYIEVCVGLLIVMLVASVAIGLGLSRLALRPVRLMQETASLIGSDNLSARIPVSTVRDEISDLARLLNQMFDRLESAFNQTRRFTAEASHELKTPLSLVRLHAEKLLVEGGLTPGQEEALQQQLEEIGRLNQIIEELLFLSRAEARAITLRSEAHDVRTFLAAFTDDARVLAEARSVRFADLSEPAGAASFDPKWIRQVLLNLLANALNVSPRGGHVTLRSAFTDGRWEVSLEDEGPGVPAEQREKIFERFVRLEPTTNSGATGSGLGLAISRSIVELHRGTIRAEAAEGGKGLRVVFALPLRAPS
jgi:two-component system heavy metal sensor histidine kinase CusS